MKELICIVCPKGCRLSVDENNDYAVSGNGCKRGAEYGRAEVLNPVRVVTYSIPCIGGTDKMCPVKTAQPISKSLVFDAAEVLKNANIKAPVKTGDVVIHDICGSGVDVVACKDILEA